MMPKTHSIDYQFITIIARREYSKLWKMSFQIPEYGHCETDQTVRLERNNLSKERFTGNEIF